VTRVDFYILERPANEALLMLACKLTAKAVDQQYEVLINTGGAEDSARLNDLLWTFAQGSFLPHRMIDDDSQPDLGGAGDHAGVFHAGQPGGVAVRAVPGLGQLCLGAELRALADESGRLIRSRASGGGHPVGGPRKIRAGNRLESGLPLLYGPLTRG
jgi:hypothetical protein